VETSNVRLFFPAPAGPQADAQLRRLTDRADLPAKWPFRAYVLLCAERGRTCHFCQTGPLYGTRFFMAPRDAGDYNLGGLVVCCPLCRKAWENKPYADFVAEQLVVAQNHVAHLESLC
jgi:hypothetical protein